MLAPLWIVPGKEKIKEERNFEERSESVEQPTTEKKSESRRKDLAWEPFNERQHRHRTSRIKCLCGIPYSEKYPLFHPAIFQCRQRPIKSLLPSLAIWNGRNGRAPCWWPTRGRYRWTTRFGMTSMKVMEVRALVGSGRLRARGMSTAKNRYKPSAWTTNQYRFPFEAHSPGQSRRATRSIVGTSTYRSRKRKCTIYGWLTTTLT